MSALDRRHFLAAGASVITGLTMSAAAEQPVAAGKVVLPPAGKKILLSCKLGMIASENADKKPIPIADRLKMAADAGLDGVDFDEAGSFTPEEAREAVRASGVFVHNAINHEHWKTRFTDASQEVRDKARANLEHTLKVSHAAGGSGVLLVIGRKSDGEEAELEERVRVELKKVLPLAASLGQRILFENVWNGMHYDHETPAPPEQTPDRFIRFIDSFRSPWVGEYYDIGNHWKYGNPGEWIRAFGPRAVKFDLKGFSRAKNKFVEITGEEDDLPWADVRKAIADTNWSGWVTAEVDGGDVKKLTTVREQMQRALGL